MVIKPVVLYKVHEKAILLENIQDGKDYSFTWHSKNKLHM